MLAGWPKSVVSPPNLPPFPPQTNGVIFVHRSLLPQIYLFPPKSMCFSPKICLLFPKSICFPPKIYLLFPQICLAAGWLAPCHASEFVQTKSQKAGLMRSQGTAGDSNDACFNRFKPWSKRPVRQSREESVVLNSTKCNL